MYCKTFVLLYFSTTKEPLHSTWREVDDDDFTQAVCINCKLLLSV